jgi:esterase
MRLGTAPGRGHTARRCPLRARPVHPLLPTTRSSSPAVGDFATGTGADRGDPSSRFTGRWPTPGGGIRWRRSSPRLRVLVLDWRGQGRSARPRPPAYRSEDFAADLRGVIERLGLTGAVVAGHSMGGHAALAFAAWHPAHLARLVVLDARPHVGPRRLPANPGRSARGPVMFPTREAAVARFRLRPPETTAPPALLRAVARAGIRRAGSGHWVYRFDPAYERTRAPVDAWPLLPGITAPTLVIRGEHSAILTHDLARRMIEAIPDAWLAEIPAAYHHVTLDAPGRVAEAILAWLD